MRLKGVKQHDEKDCGAAVFATILNSYGDRISLARARELVHTSKMGSSFYGLNEAAQSLGFESNVLEIEDLENPISELLGEISNGNVKFPAIAHVVTYKGLEHFVVIDKIKQDSVIIFDPDSGDKKKVSFEEFTEIWTGMMMTLFPAEGWQPKFREKWRFRKYFNLIEKVKFKIISVILFSFMISGISIIGSLLYRRVIDGFILKGSKTAFASGHFEDIFSMIFSNLNSLFLATLVLYLFQAILLMVRTYFIAEISVKSGELLFINLFKKLMKLPMTFFAFRESGDLLARFQIVSEFQEKLADVIISIFMESFLAFAGGFVLYKISPNLFGVTCVLVLCYLLITMVFIKPLKKISSQVIDANCETLTVYTQSLNGIEEIKMLSAQKRFVKQFQEKVHKLLESGKRGIILHNIQTTLVFLMEMFGVIFIFWRGSMMVLDRIITLGSLMSFNMLIFYFITPLKNIIEKQKEVQDLLVMADKLDDVFEVDNEEALSPEKKFPINLQNVLELRNVSFSYGMTALILDDVNQKFFSGKHYVISGKSGVGKTSLLKLLASLGVPDKGEVFFNGMNIAENYFEYRKFVSYVPNDPILFSGTIRENLWLDNKDKIEKKDEEVLRRVGIYDLVGELSDGLKSKVSEDGKNFSSGQRQRIVLARALLHEPKILLLDEALSNLDRESQTSILEFIEERMVDGLLISISHDLNLVQTSEVFEIKNQILKKKIF